MRTSYKLQTATLTNMCMFKHCHVSCNKENIKLCIITRCTSLKNSLIFMSSALKKPE